MYAYGVTLWEIASRRIPYAEVKDFSILQSLIKQGNREKIPSDCPPNIANLIRLCWDSNPENRPKAEEALACLNSSDGLKLVV